MSCEVTEAVGDKVVAPAAEIPESSEALRASGVALANAGHLRAALPLFLAAVALSPNDPQAHSDEGVTWMRLHEYEQSWGAFKRALLLAPSHAVARDNREELRAYLLHHPNGNRIVAADAPRPPPRAPRRREHAVEPLRRASRLPSAAGWWQAPFVLPERRGRARRERAANATALEAALPRLFPRARAEYYPGGMVHAGVKPTFLPLGEALRRVRGAAGRAGKAYLQLNLAPDEWEQLVELVGVREPLFVGGVGGEMGTPATLPGQRCARALTSAGKMRDFHLDTHWRMFVMGGGEGAGMFLHPDTLRTSSWQMQLRGRKRWHLCPGEGGPEAAAHRYCSAADVDTFDPDYSKCPSFKKATCYEGVLSPGEVLFYPEDYWHQTQGLDEGNAAISGTLVTPSNRKLVAQELQKECAGANRIIPRGSSLCDPLSVCIQEWQ
ncbi:hypothetical protein AB1Y20_016349 [Prymnesium parvum]|uniref:JmjC domain-containing protein n=1 Tax=Prymnesium parvum TaxID=97485 RepID=A0AB34IEX5_PRYPA